MMVTEIKSNDNDSEYSAFIGRVDARLRANAIGQPMFTTDTAGLSNVYLSAFPEDQRQYHNCCACKTFIDRYGGLVIIDDKGRTTPALWSEEDAPDEERPSWVAMAALVRKAKVTGVFLSSEATWGSGPAKGWQHIIVRNPGVFFSPVLTAEQKMAEKKEDYRLVLAALQEFPESAVDAVLPLLRNDQLYRSEKVLGVAEWFKKRHEEWAKAKGPAKTNLLWKAVATAPAGFCHIRSGMIGTLLEDVVAGLPFADVAAKFKAKMHPLQYMRPQEAPSEGNVAAAEKVIEKLRAAGALDRRFAGLDDVTDTLWRPTSEAPAEAKGGVFGHVKTKQEAPLIPSALQAPPVTMTWSKFQKTVLPTAVAITTRTPSYGKFTMLTTASNPDAPPILQWDRREQRNPVAWYLRYGGSHAANVGLRAGDTPVVCIVELPCHWHGSQSPNQQHRPLMLLQGAKDDTGVGGGLALFPECLISELHGVRRTIEQFSRHGKLDASTSPAAVGLPVIGSTVTVKDWAGSFSRYTIDRLD